MKQVVAAVHESLHGTKRTSPPRRSTLALSPIRDTLIEGFSHFVTSMTARIASGWSGCRVGFAPTGKRRLVTAHTQLGHWVAASGVDWLPFPTRRPSPSVRLEASMSFSLGGIHETARFHHGTWY